MVLLHKTTIKLYEHDETTSPDRKFIRKIFKVILPSTSIKADFFSQRGSRLHYTMKEVALNINTLFIILAFQNMW